MAMAVDADVFSPKFLQAKAEGVAAVEDHSQQSPESFASDTERI
jgi:hypothetical protein